MDTTTINSNSRFTCTKQEKQKFIEQWQESGKTMKAFSNEHQIKYATFISWVHPKKNRKKTLKVFETSSGFIPVDIHNDSSGVFAEAKLGNGKSVFVYQYVPADYLRSLLS